MKKLIVCVNRRSNPAQPSCAMRGSRELLSLVSAEITQREWPLEVEEFLCLGLCAHGPNAKLSPDGPILKHLKPEKLDSLIAEIEVFLRK